MSNLTGIAYQNMLFATALALLMAGLGYTFLRPQTAFRQFISRRAAAIMWGSTILMAGFWWVLGVLRYHGFHTSLVDMGTFTNVLWNTAHGRIMGTAISWSTHFTQHFSPSLILVAMLYVPWQSPDWLIGLTALTVASGGPALFYIARHRGLTSGTALVISALWLYSSLVRAPLLADFHETLIAAPVLLWAVFFIIKKKLVPALLLAFVALGFKEDMPVFVFGLGLIILWSFRLKTMGYLISALAIGYYLLVNLWLWELITPLHLDFLAIRFPQLVTQPGGVWASILFDPSILITPLLHWEQLWVVLMLFIPVLFLPFFRPGSVGLLPCIWMLLSLESFTVLILGLHYHLVLFALILVAAVAGYEVFSKIKPGFSELLKWLLVSFTVCFIFASPMMMIADRQLNPDYYQPHRYYSLVQEIADKTPAEKSVTADYFMGTIFSNRYNIRHFPGDILSDRIMLSNSFMGNPVTLLAIGGLGYNSLVYNPCFWLLSLDGTVDPRQDYMDTMRWMEAEGCGFPPWGTVTDYRASGRATVFIPECAGYGARIQATPYLFLPPGNYTYSVRLRAACPVQNQPIVVLEARELKASGENIILGGNVFDRNIKLSKSDYQYLTLDFEVQEWGLTHLSINFGIVGSYWWDGVGLDGLAMDFTGLYNQLIVRETSAGAICLYPQAGFAGEAQLFADAVTMDDRFANITICRWDLRDLEAGDYWIWYVDDVDSEDTYLNWAEVFAVSVDPRGSLHRRKIGILEVERSVWTNAPNLRRFKAHLLPGDKIEIDTLQGLPAKIKLVKLWIMRDLPMSLDYFCE